MNCPKCDSKLLSKISDDRYVCSDCRNEFTEEFVVMANQRRFMHEQFEKLSKQVSKAQSTYEMFKSKI